MSEASTVRSSDLPHLTWRKSSRSDDGGSANCVEVAALPDLVVLRDSKNPAGPVLGFRRGEWRLFLGGVRVGRFG